eukprot:TRINITY_DN92_c1_g1_i1.p1 TRINITY_DN92_c1_g1~~TRINITY_DN92_c1_g1_i1.p1  ORF type:complete len:1654 (+),score=308.67 TRINITY_DN92_c1_g1_i1:157-4962(+)
MPFPDNLGPFGVVPLANDMLPEVHFGRPPPEFAPGVSDLLACNRHGWYCLDMRKGVDRAALMVRIDLCPLSFDGVRVAAVLNESGLEFHSPLAAPSAVAERQSTAVPTLSSMHVPDLAVLPQYSYARPTPTRENSGRFTASAARIVSPRRELSAPWSVGTSRREFSHVLFTTESGAETPSAKMNCTEQLTPDSRDLWSPLLRLAPGGGCCPPALQIALTIGQQTVAARQGAGGNRADAADLASSARRSPERASSPARPPTSRLEHSTRFPSAFSGLRSPQTLGSSARFPRDRSSTASLRTPLRTQTSQPTSSSSRVGDGMGWSTSLRPRVGYPCSPVLAPPSESSKLRRPTVRSPCTPELPQRRKSDLPAPIPRAPSSLGGGDLLAAVLPGMRVVSINGMAVHSPEDIEQHYQGSTCILEVQDDESAALLPLHRAGLSGCGQLSPAVPVTHASADRRAVHVPEWAESYRMAYPIEGLLDVPAAVMEGLDWGDPSLCLALIGGFIYFDGTGEVCGACALTHGETMHFDGPFRWRPEYTEELRADGRIAPVPPLPHLRDAGAASFAYLVPNETLGGPNGSQTWRMARHGGYVYFLDPALRKHGSASEPSPVSSPRRHLRRSIGEGSEADYAIFFVALAEDTGADADSWEQIRVCPHCRSQQREDLAVQEVPGAMRCDNCGQLSVLSEKGEDAEAGQDLLRALGTLLSYFVVLGAYIVLGASVMRAVELPKERELVRRARMRYDKSIADAAWNLSELANSSGGLNAGEVEGHLWKLVGALEAGDSAFPIACTPTTHLQWERFTDALFWVYCMVITIPELFPVTHAGRVFFVFYVIGGLICVLSVVFDLAHVFPSVVRAFFRLCRHKRPAGVAATQRQMQEDLFDKADYDGTGTLTLGEFREFLELYEGGTVHGGEPGRFPEQMVLELMMKVDDGSGELGREDVRKAVVIWERLKDEEAQVPGSYMVAGSVFGNLAWIAVCAMLLNAFEGFRIEDAVWLCFLTLTTMGFSAFIPQTVNGQLVASLYFLIGLGSLAWLFEAIGSRVQARLVRIVRALAPICPWGRHKAETAWLRVDPPVRFSVPSDPFGELSPDYPYNLEVEGKQFPSVLHFISYMRFRGTRHEKKLRVVTEVQTLEMLYHLLDSHSMAPRHDWQTVRDDLMLTALCSLIAQNRELRRLLLSTGDRPLIYDIYDAPPALVDAFELAHWGTKGESGENRLGELLQTVRHDLRRGIKTDLRPGVCSAQPIHFFGYTNAQYAMFNPSFPSPFIDREDQEWPTVDHFFQARKFVSLEYRQKIRAARTLHQLMQLGAARDVPQGVVPDWERERVRVMKEALILKFAQNPRARQLLHQTGSRELIFNDASDPFWGTKMVDGHPGANVVGRLLMALRENLRTGATPKQMLAENDQAVMDAAAMSDRHGMSTPMGMSSLQSWSMLSPGRKGSRKLGRKQFSMNRNGSASEQSTSVSSPAASSAAQSPLLRSCQIPRVVSDDGAVRLARAEGASPPGCSARRSTASRDGVTGPAISLSGWSPAALGVSELFSSDNRSDADALGPVLRAAAEADVCSPNALNADRLPSPVDSLAASGDAVPQRQPRILPPAQAATS